MIITRLAGGLGNQMFQYAAALALAERHHAALKLDLSYFERREATELHNKYALGCLNITEQFTSSDEVRRMYLSQFTSAGKTVLTMAEVLGLKRLSVRIAGARQRGSTIRLRGRLLRSLFINPYNQWHIQPTVRYYSRFEELTNDCYLEGLFQSEKFFQSVEDQLRLHFSFRYPPTNQVSEIARRIANEETPVALHFRRGDYVSNKIFANLCGALPLDYYYRAVRLVREKNPEAVLYIFSDDIEMVEREFKPEGKHFFVRSIKPWHVYDNIRLMSMCHHQVIANSTFSWWAAWLNPFPSKLVIAPTPWFADSITQDNDLIPSNWMRLSR